MLVLSREREKQRSHRVAGQVTGAASPGPASGLCLGPPWLHRLRPFDYLFPSRENPRDLIRNPRKVSTPSSSPNPSRGVLELSRHPAGGRNHRGRPSSSPCLPTR